MRDKGRTLAPVRPICGCCPVGARSKARGHIRGVHRDSDVAALSAILPRDALFVMRLQKLLHLTSMLRQDKVCVVVVVCSDDAGPDSHAGERCLSEEVDDCGRLLGSRLVAVCMSPSSPVVRPGHSCNAARHHEREPKVREVAPAREVGWIVAGVYAEGPLCRHAATAVCSPPSTAATSDYLPLTYPKRRTPFRRIDKAAALRGGCVHTPRAPREYRERQTDRQSPPRMLSTSMSRLPLQGWGSLYTF